MVATPIAVETRYFNPETTKVYWVASIAVKTAPTRVELNAGVDVSKAIADVNGWMVGTEMIPTPDMGSRYTGQIPGRTSSDNSTITYYAGKNGIDARGTMPRDATGFMVWLDGGDVTGYKMDVYPTTVSSHGKQRSVGNDPARIVISYAITSEPAENVAIPA